MAVTLKDIAKESGFHVATVSRSLNHAYGVKEETRNKVLAVATRLAYRPNRVAWGLATGRSHTFGLVITDIRNPFFAELARGAEDAACAAGYDIVLCNSDLNPEKQAQYVRSLQEKRVAGIVVNAITGLTPSLRAELARLGIPVVLLTRLPSGCDFSTVTADNFQGGFLAGSYLLSLGHRTIALLSGPPRHGNLSERIKGFMKTIGSDGKRIAIVVQGPQTFQGGYDAAKRLLANLRKVTAIFAANDVMAFGAIRALYEAGLKIPEDMSVIGFDNVELAAITHPPLTTIDQPIYDAGRAAVEILLKQNQRPGTWTPEHRLLGVKLVERESCRAPQEHSRGGNREYNYTQPRSGQLRPRM